MSGAIVDAKQGKFILHESYYQPTYYGGNYGTKECIMKNVATK